MSCGIYGIYNLQTNKWYVGQSTDLHKRITTHKSLLRHSKPHENHHLLKAWEIYGEESFEFYVLEECDKNQLNEREIYWIGLLDSYFNGYNQTLGGGGVRGFILPDGSRKRQAESMRKVWADPQYREKMAVILKDAQSREDVKKNRSIIMKRIWSDEQYKASRCAKIAEAQRTTEARAKRSEISKAMWSDEEFYKATREKINEKLRTDEYRTAQSQRMKEIAMDPEHIKKRSISIKKSWENSQTREKHIKAAKNNWASEEYKQKVIPALKKAQELGKKPIVNVETGETFSSIVEACERYPCANSSHVSDCCNGARLTTGGFHWRYASETEREWRIRRLNYIDKMIQEGKEAHLSRMILCIETGEIFESAEDAAKEKKMYRGHISAVCRGKRKTAGNYHWRFVKEGDL